VNSTGKTPSVIFQIHKCVVDVVLRIVLKILGEWKRRRIDVWLQFILVSVIEPPLTRLCTPIDDEIVRVNVLTALIMDHFGTREPGTSFRRFTRNKHTVAAPTNG
jgi:hypothetical protein